MKTNLAISKLLSATRHTLTREEHHGLREECRRYANLMIEAKPGKYVRREALETLKRAEAAR